MPKCQVRLLAIRFVNRTSDCVICATPRLPGGISKSQCLNARSSRMGKPLSAIMVSYASSMSRKPECKVTCLSLARPPQPLEIKFIMPEGVMLTKALTVWWCL